MVDTGRLAAMMHLLDTGVVWELRRGGGTAGGVAGWASGLPRSSLFVSALSVMELTVGAGEIERRDRAAGARARQWIDDQMLPAFEGRVLAVDAAVAARAAKLDHVDRRDALLAATALVHGLTLATRHPGDFKAGRIKTVNPWRHANDTPDDDLDWRQASRTGPQWLRSLFVRS